MPGRATGVPGEAVARGRELYLGLAAVSAAALAYPSPPGLMPCATGQSPELQPEAVVSGPRPPAQPAHGALEPVVGRGGAPDLG